MLDFLWNAGAVLFVFAIGSLAVWGLIGAVEWLTEEWRDEQ